MPRMMERNFGFYEEEYWDYIKKYLNDTKDINYLLNILRNNSIYSFHSNLDHLYDIVSGLVAIDNVDDISNRQKEYLLEIASKILVLIKKSHSIITSNMELDFLNIMSELIDKYELIDTAISIDLSTIYGSDLVLFALMYYFLNDEKYVIVDDYDDWLSTDFRTRKAFLDYIIDIFIEKEKLNSTELELIFPAIGPKMTKRINQSISLRVDLTFPFDRNTFEDLLD